MPADQARELRAARELLALFDGAEVEAIEKFSASVNVGVALGHTTGLWEETTVRIIADLGAGRNRHEILAGGTAGTYEFRIENQPSPDNPRHQRRGGRGGPQRNPHPQRGTWLRDLTPPERGRCVGRSPCGGGGSILLGAVRAARAC